MKKYRAIEAIALEAVPADDGGVEYEAKVLDLGKKVQRGGAGEFEVTADHLGQMVANFERERAAGFEPPAFVGHPVKRDEAPAVGWIKALRATPEGLVARVRLLKDFASKVAEGAYRFVSPTFAFKWADESGAERGAKLLDLGVLNTPFQKGLGGLTPAASLHEVAESDEDDDMSDTQKTTELAAQVGTLTAKLTEQSDLVTKLAERLEASEAATAEREAKLAELSEKLTAAEAKTVELGAQADAARKANEARDIMALCEQGIRLGKLAPRQVPGFGKPEFDPHAWLDGSPYKGIVGLSAHLQTTPPVVDLSGRQSGGSGDDEGSDDHQMATNLAAIKLVNPQLSDAAAREIAARYVEA